MPASKPASVVKEEPKVPMVSMKTAREFLSAAKAKDPKRQQTLISKAFEEVKHGQVGKNLKNLKNLKNQEDPGKKRKRAENLNLENIKAFNKGARQPL